MGGKLDYGCWENLGHSLLIMKEIQLIKIT